MVASVKKCGCWLLFLLACTALSSAVFAHQLDEYLEATLVAIEPDDVHLQINLSPGVAVADKVLALIDTDKNGVISGNEASAYAALVQRDLIVRIDQVNVELKLNAVNFPEVNELKTGWGIIQMDFSVVHGALASGTHKFTLENRHLPTMSVYLFNAEQPRSDLIQITKQTRNQTQSIGAIEFSYIPPKNSPKSAKYIASAAGLIIVIIVGIWRRVDTSR